MIKVTKTDFINLEYKINEIGWENILQVIPSHEFNTTLYVILYK